MFYFRHRDAPEHHEVLLPEGAAAKFADSAVLWNAAEAAERRKDAQVAREIVLALPANAELTDADRIELARSFAEQHFVAKGLAVQLDVHRPPRGRQRVRAGELARASADHHAAAGGRTAFAAKKARDLDPEVRRAGGRAVVADGEAWGELWRDHQNRYFAEHGLDVRVDVTATHAQEHIGPVRMRARKLRRRTRREINAGQRSRGARSGPGAGGADAQQRDLHRARSRSASGQHLRTEASAARSAADPVLGHPGRAWPA